MMDQFDSADGHKLYFGKYRGTVYDNFDPMQMGRLQALVPDVLGDQPSSWAMPCFPIGGTQNGMFYVPIIGAGVWIEFEQGDPDYPVWSGCYYASAADVPSMAKSVPPEVFAITLQTPDTNGLTISDLPGENGGILLQTAGGASISLSELGITISNGQGAIITLKGSTVDVNNQALTIT